MSESLDSPTYGEAEKPRDPISPLNPRRAERFNPTRFTLHTGGFSFFDSLGTSATAALRQVAHRFAALPAWAQVLSIWAPSRLWGVYHFLDRRYAAGCRSAENRRRPCAHPS